MYPEFVAIYIMLGVLILLMAAVLFLLVKIIKAGGPGKRELFAGSQQINSQYYAQPYQQQQAYQVQGTSVVFCMQCSTQYDSSLSCCPRCGAKR